MVARTQCASRVPCVHCESNCYTFEMALPKRISDQSEFRSPRAASDNINALRAASDNSHLTAVNDNESETVVRHLDSGLRAPGGYKRAFKEITRRLHLEGKLEGKNVFVLHSKENVAAHEAFSEAEVKSFEKTYGMAGKLARHGYGAEKRDVESYVGPNADIVILLDGDVKITRQVLLKIKPGGYFICIPSAASEALKRGEFQFEGIVSMGGTGPDFKKSTKAFGSVETDEELKKAQSGDEFVSYDEALEVVKKAGLKAGSVIESYKTLLEEVGDDLTYEMPDGSVETLKLLPDKAGSWWILKKKGSSSTRQSTARAA